MHTSILENNLINNNEYKKYIVTFSISLCLLILFLMLPVNNYINQQEQLIELKLTKERLSNKTLVQKRPAQTPKEKTNKQVKPVVVEQIKSKHADKKQPKIKIIQPNNESLTAQKIKKEPIKLPTTAELMSTFKKNKNNFQVSKDFQMKTGREQDYIYKEVQKDPIFIATKILNEEVDKPMFEMNFYSEGIVGGVEKFMDKITYKKRFTTKYGTQIDCASVAIVLTACSWK